MARDAAGRRREARKRIIDATLKCVERRGPSATTVTDVADAAGITRRAVYRYFSSTEELFTAAAAVALDGWTDRIEELTADMSDPTELLVEAVAHLIEGLPERAAALSAVRQRPHPAVQQGHGAAGVDQALSDRVGAQQD